VLVLEPAIVPLMQMPALVLRILKQKQNPTGVLIIKTNWIYNLMQKQAPELTSVLQVRPAQQPHMLVFIRMTHTLTTGLKLASDAVF